MNEENNPLNDNQANKPEQNPSDNRNNEQSPQQENTPTPQPAPEPAKPVDITQKPISRQNTEAPSRGLKVDGDDDAMDRRSFIKWLTIGWAAFAGIVGGYGSLMLRYLFPNVLFEPKQSFLAGAIDDYVVGEVSERFKAQYGVWIVRDDEKIFALSTVCTHLGCTPNWLAAEGKYKCPCHGSGFYKTGINFEGPAPRPLERFKITLSDDGEIVIDKTKKFQQEKGEWSDPESFILV